MDRAAHALGAPLVAALGAAVLCCHACDGRHGHQDGQYEVAAHFICLVEGEKTGVAESEGEGE